MKKNYLGRYGYLLIITAISLYSFSPYLFGPGLTEVEPVAGFLNGNFPDITEDANPYKPAFPNITFRDPLTFEPVPNTNRLLVGEIDGEIYWFENNESTTTKTLLRDFSAEMGDVFDGGFLGLAANPRFGQPGHNYIYMYYNGLYGNTIGNLNPADGFVCDNDNIAPAGHYMILRRIQVDPVTFESIPENDLVMMRTKMFGWTHWGGGMKFGLDGFLYLPTGENAGYQRAQEIDDNLYGGVLRLDVDMDASKSHPPIKKMPNRAAFPEEISGEGYYIPNDNPFPSPDGSSFEEYFSLGHRNPHRLSVDRLTGEIYVGEVGGGQHEEVNVIESGKNYGWPVFEGLASGPGNSCTDIYENMPVENPLTAFTRGDSNALIGGFVYRGIAMPEYYGKYICGNWGGGNRVWSVDTQTGEYNQIFSFLPGDLWGFGEDHDGELYILKRGNTNLYRIQPNNGTNEGNFPQFLSQTGAFEDLATLKPSEGVIPYELIESFWSDGAEKQRWMVVPNDGTHDTRAEQIGFSENEAWNFPEGSVLIKHFEFPTDENNPNIKKRLETRFTVKTSNGNFYYLTYKWNAQGTDAELLETGLDEDFTINLASGGTRTQTWSYPDDADCRTCHSAIKNNTLGPRTRYLNSDYLYPKTGITGNQLVTLSHLGVLDENITDNTTPNFLTFSARNSNASLEEKARSYLDLNCAYCHSPGGVAERAGINMSMNIPLFETGLLDKVILPGNAQASDLIVRMGSITPGYGMPPLAKNVVDEEGLSLITDWINSLDPNLYGITGVEITSEESTVNVSESIQLTANVLPDDVQVNETVTWTSSNHLIATVDENGLVQGLLPGTVIITAETYEAGFRASSEITVTQFNDSDPGNCVSTFENENTEISLTPIGFVSGLDTIEGTSTTTFNSSCAIELSNTDAGQPWSRYELQIDLAANGIVAGDGLFISIDAEGSNGNGRFEINAMDSGNTTLDFVDFGSGWSNFQKTIVVPENINAIEFELYTNYNNAVGGSMIFDNLIVVNTGKIIDVTPPEIILTGANTLELSELDTYIEIGYSADDDIDGNITNNVIVGGDTVDTNVPGTYVITYNVTDNAGNIADEKRRTVTVFTIRESCASYFQNENPSILLPLGSTTAGADNAAGTTSITNNSDCAFEVSNFDEGQRWSRYNIPIVLADHGIAPGDRLSVSIDANSTNGQGRIAIGQDNTPNTDLTGTNFSGGWSSFSDTVTVPTGITTLNVWLYSNYNSTVPGTVVYDNLNIVNLDDTPCDGAPHNTYFADTDGDGFGDPENTLDACQLPDGYVTDNTDCDDTRAESYPGAPELCDGLDNNCDGNIDEGAQDCDPVDTTAPIITLDGPAALELLLGEPYTEPGFLATDDTDGEITANVTIGGDTVDSDTEGTYTITYDVNDTAGNSAQQVTRIVTVSTTTGPVTCNDYLENDNTAIPLPIGNLTAGGDEVRGTDADTNNSDCALEVSNFDEGQRWSRYNIPIVLADHGIAPGDRLSVSIDANSTSGQGRIAIARDNTPNTVISEMNFSGGWSSFSDTVTVPTGITTLNVWLYSNYNSTVPGTVVYDNLNIVNLDDTPCDGAPHNTYFADTDGDGFGDPENTLDACQLPDGYVTDNTDCDDTRAESYPGAPELCDGLDNNCDGNIDEGAQDCDPVDTTAPIITLDGPAALELLLGEPYTEPGFLATDDTDGEITANVTIGGDTVDSDTEGTYTITYDVNDTAGNSAQQVTRIVTVSTTTGPVTCNDYLENDNTAIPLPIGNLTAGGDEVRGTDADTNNSDCALEVSNFDEGQRWSRYNIPIVLADHGIAPGDRLSVSIDANSTSGQGRIAIARDNTPNTVISEMNFSGGWSSFSDTVTVPTGITTLNVWLYSNYNSTVPGTVVYDNLNIVNLDDTPCDGAPHNTYFADTDGDGFGDPENTLDACQLPDGYVTDNTDCDDTRAESYPGAQELCDGLDNNCDGNIDEGAQDCDPVDTTAPIITLDGPAALELLLGEPYTEPGFLATDDTDGEITANVTIGGDTVDSDTEGTYTITYDVNDTAGNSAQQVTRIVTVSTTTGPVTCNDYLENDNTAIPLPIGNLTAGGDEVRGTDADTNNSDCALEVSNFDEGQRWSRYNIPIVLADHGIAPGDRLSVSIDANSTSGQGRIAIARDNTPNTVISEMNFSGGWSSFSDTVTVPTGITTLNVWLYSNYNSTVPGTVVYDNLNIVNLDDTPCDGAPHNTYFADTDGDGFGDPENTLDACQLPDGYVTDNTDCDDTRAESYPGAPELCDGLDNNCDGNIDEGAQDCDPVDTTAPIITLDGPAALELLLGEPYTEPGFLATDDTDGEITANVTIGGDTVDSDTEGTYTITYDVSDTAGNSAQQVTRIVTVSTTTGPVTCNDYLENDNTAIPLPIGNLTAGGDELRGTDADTNNSDCALEVSNFDEGQRWSRYNIPIVLADHGIAPGDRLSVSIDANSTSGQGRIAIARDNTPNTVISEMNFSGGWSSFSDTVTVPTGITTLNVWLYSNYNSTVPGTVVYDNLNIVNLDDNPINLLANLNNMIISPNPAKDSSILSFDNPESLTEINIFDITGRLIKQFNAQDIKRGNYYDLQLYEIPTGTYIVRAKNKEGIEFSKKIIIVE